MTSRVVRRFVAWWVIYEDVRGPDGYRKVTVNVLPAVVGLAVVAAVIGVTT